MRSVQRLVAIGSWIAGVAGHLSKRETLVPALIALVVSGIVGPVSTGLMNRHNAEMHDQEEAKRQAVARFELEADSFGAFVTVFVLDISRDNRVDPEALHRLAANLANQKAALDTLALHLPLELRPKAMAYERALLDFNAALGKVTDVETMRDFWERNSDLQVAKRNFLPWLEAAKSHASVRLVD
jgi:hypothetical protein